MGRIAVQSENKTDLLVVGSGIVGMACALAGVRRGWSVQVIEREALSIGASIRNFGFVTVTGQGSGTTWRRARRSRDVWAEVAPQAGIAVLHQGLYVPAQRPEAVAVLHALLQTEAGAELQWLSPQALQQRAPQLAHADILGALYSPHELRIESRVAVEQLRQWLAAQGVRFQMQCAVNAVQSGRVQAGAQAWHAERIVVCPGPDLRTLFPEVFARRAARLCQLQMLRVRPPQGYVLPAAVMSDLSLVRYRGYAELPAAAALEQRLRQEQAQELSDGIHLIAVQSADGSLVVGDSHHYAASPAPFASDAVDERILAEMQRVLRLAHYRVEERWTGVYPVASADAFYDTVLPAVQVLSVTSGTGMSTAFALAEECLEQGV